MTFYSQKRSYSSFENNTGRTDEHNLLQICVVAFKNYKKIDQRCRHTSARMSARYRRRPHSITRWCLWRGNTQRWWHCHRSQWNLYQIVDTLKVRVIRLSKQTISSAMGGQSKQPAFYHPLIIVSFCPLTWFDDRVSLEVVVAVLDGEAMVGPPGGVLTTLSARCWICDWRIFFNKTNFASSFRNSAWHVNINF